jgi:ATP-binding cassette subfamily F protein 3
MSEVLLQISAGIKGFGGRQLFESASFAVNEGEHVGVIGPNGAGKTTLFKILAGVEELDGGQIIRSQRLRLAYLAQEDNFPITKSATEYLESTASLPLWDLKQMGIKLGLSEDHFQQPLASLSGGYRMRVKLLGLIGQDPNVMLLDEPTNYLDLESVLVLESFLQSFKGAFLLISHDREFLKRTTDHTLEVEGGQFTKYNGNIDDYFEQKALVREQIEKQALSQMAKRQAVLDFAAKFGAKATKARQVQSRLKQLDRMEMIDVLPLQLQARITIPSPVHTGKQVLAVEKARLGYGKHTILDQVDFVLARGAHLAVVGENGAGKSTLLKAVAGQLPALAGNLEWGYGVQIGYYAQHVAENLAPTDSVIEAIQRKAHPDVTLQQAKDLAGSLLFSGETIEKKIRVLSGGEKARVALGQILLQRAPLLVLDEPTNHLDFHTVEALTQALNDYEGSVMLVSHDRSFVRRVATQILEVKSGEVSLYPGSYEEYVWSTQQRYLGDSSESRRSSGRTDTAAEDVKEKGRAPVNNWEKKKVLTKTLKQSERQLEKLFELIGKIDVELLHLAEKIQVISGLEAQEMGRKIHSLGQEKEANETQWMELADIVENLRREIEALS